MLVLDYSSALKLAQLEVPTLLPRILAQLFSALEAGRIVGVAANQDEQSQEE